MRRWGTSTAKKHFNYDGAQWRNHCHQLVQGAALRNTFPRKDRSQIFPASKPHYNVLGACSKYNSRLRFLYDPAPSKRFLPLIVLVCSLARSLVTLSRMSLRGHGVVFQPGAWQARTILKTSKDTSGLRQTVTFGFVWRAWHPRGGVVRRRKPACEIRPHLRATTCQKNKKELLA